MSSISDLYAQVYANPDDDECRRILADALIAIDDPRGELITFQYRPDADYQRRSMRLVQQNGLSWLGPLRGAVIPLGYERGFVAHCQVIDMAAANEVASAPEWNTIHTIELQGAVEQPEFLLGEMKSLVTLRTVTAMTFDWLSKQKLPPRLATIRMADSRAPARTRVERLPLTVKRVEYGVSYFARDAGGVWIEHD